MGSGSKTQTPCPCPREAVCPLCKTCKRGSGCGATAGWAFIGSVPRDSTEYHLAARSGAGNRIRLQSQTHEQVAQGGGGVVEVVGVGDLDGVYGFRTKQNDLHTRIVPILLLALAVCLEGLSGIAKLIEADLLPRVMVEGDPESQWSCASPSVLPISFMKARLSPAPPTKGGSQRCNRCGTAGSSPGVPCRYCSMTGHHDRSHPTIHAVRKPP